MSKDTARNRLMMITAEDRMACYDPERTISDLEGDIDRLKTELALAQQQVVQAQVSNANWRHQYEKLAADVESWKAEAMGVTEAGK